MDRTLFLGSIMNCIVQYAQCYQVEAHPKTLFPFTGIFGMNLRSYLEEHMVCV